MADETKLIEKVAKEIGVDFNKPPADCMELAKKVVEVYRNQKAKPNGANK